MQVDRENDPSDLQSNPTYLIRYVEFDESAKLEICVGKLTGG